MKTDNPDKPELTDFQREFQSRLNQLQEARRNGWITCPVCEGMGNLFDRFTHKGQVCPVCDGFGLIQSAIIVEVHWKND